MRAESSIHFFSRALPSFERWERPSDAVSWESRRQISAAVVRIFATMKRAQDRVRLSLGNLHARRHQWQRDSRTSAESDHPGRFVHGPLLNSGHAGSTDGFVAKPRRHTPWCPRTESRRAYMSSAREARQRQRPRHGQRHESRAPGCHPDVYDATVAFGGGRRRAENCRKLSE